MSSKRKPPTQCGLLLNVFKGDELFFSFSVQFPINKIVHTKTFGKTNVVRNEGNIVYNNTLHTFYFTVICCQTMVKDHSDSEKENMLPLHEHIKEPLLLIGKSSPCGGSGFPLSLSEWSFTICLTPYNRK